MISTLKTMKAGDIIEKEWGWDIGLPEMLK